MPRPQFSLKTLLWLMALVAAFSLLARFIASPANTSLLQFAITVAACVLAILAIDRLCFP
jgi:hypothetical protein